MTDRVGQQLGNYRLLRLLSTGGFAEVYLGGHVYLTTQAAIKVLQTRLAGDEQERFLQEARIIARLIHPNIVRVLEFGVEGDVPFLVMDYAPNGTLRQRYPRGTGLTSLEVLPTLKQVAAALQYAHNHRFIHRDVKPENMLLGKNDEVLLSDFGIALIAQSARFQDTQDVYGTASYMAPEQIQGKAQPASDQYALGIVVYEWFSGDVPFHGSFTELCSQHLFAPLPPLRDKVPTLSPALEAVVEKALAKDPKSRFPSVGEMASAFEEACQAEQPMIAGTETTLRRPVPSEAESEEFTSIPPTQPVSAATVRSPVLPSLTPRTPSAKRGISRRLVIAGIAATGLAVVSGFTWYLYSQPEQQSSSSSTRFTAPPSPSTSTQSLGKTLFTYREHTDTVYALAWSPNSQYMASGSADTTVRVWNVSTGDTLYTYHGHAGLFNSVFTIGWSSNGGRLASGGADKTVQVWDAANGNRILLYQAHTARVLAVGWSPDGKSLASGGADKTVQVWDAVSGATISTYIGHTDTVYALAWSPDGKFIVSGSADKTVQLWDAATGKVISTYHGHAETVYTVAWSPDGKYIVSGGADRTVQVWDAATGKTLSTYHGHSGLSTVVTTATWSPDGKGIASGSTDKTVQIWEAATGKHAYTYREHTASVYTVEWSFDGQHIASGSADHMVRIWQAS